MTPEELAAENEKEAEEKAALEDKGEVKSDDEPKPEDEPWMKEEDEQASDDPSKSMPVSKHVKMKHKLRGALKEEQDENERLRKENEELKRKTKTDEEPLERPKRSEFETDDDFDDAMDVYQDRRTAKTLKHNTLKQDQERAQIEAMQNQQKSVNDHYDRAAELVESAGIKEEVYQAADKKVRAAIDVLVPGKGDVLTDHFISILGKGSEKVLFYLGRNPAALSKFQKLLKEDPLGLSAAVYLGREKQRLTKPIKMQSQAPNPASSIKGDSAPVSGNEKALKKVYQAAHKKGNVQASYDARKKAKAAGYDVSDW